ncbi:MAG: permease-like cell division protein FtsX [Candidatus Saccharimonadales bacterium]
MAKHSEPRALIQNKKARRKWLTFVRMCRYGVNNFSRNLWLTIAATIVMTVTLLIIFITLSARQVLVDTISQIKDKVDMSIYVKADTTEKDARQIKSELAKLSAVTSVTYTNSQQGREKTAREYKSDTDVLNAINEATNKIPGVFNVKISDINNPAELDNFVKTNKFYIAHADAEYPPSFSGTKRSVIENIGRWVNFAEKVGIIASIVFIIISSLIVFNTIRMAIFNRKEEIQMMKLIGADRSFIRGPFVVEAVVYGFIAALLGTGLGVAGLYASRDTLESYEIAISGTIENVTLYIGVVLIGMILAGSIIGVVSSLLATRKYLKI